MVFDQTGRMIEQETENDFEKAKDFMNEQHNKGYDTHFKTLGFVHETKSN